LSTLAYIAIFGGSTTSFEVWVVAAAAIATGVAKKNGLADVTNFASHLRSVAHPTSLMNYLAEHSAVESTRFSSPSHPALAPSSRQHVLGTWDLQGAVPSAFSDIMPNLSALVRAESGHALGSNAKRIHFESLADGWMRVRMQVGEWAPQVTAMCRVQVLCDGEQSEERTTVTIYGDTPNYRRAKIAAMAALAAILLLPFVMHFTGAFHVHALIAPLLAVALAGHFAHLSYRRMQEVESRLVATLSAHFAPQALSLRPGIDPFRRSKSLALARAT
jgi:hypothetical protein